MLSAYISCSLALLLAKFAPFPVPCTSDHTDLFHNFQQEADAAGPISGINHVKLLEDLAELSVDKCRAQGVQVDYYALKDELISCYNATTSNIIKVWTMLIDELERPDYAIHIEQVQTTMENEMLLSESQKQWLRYSLLRSMCSQLMPTMSDTCGKHPGKYPRLAEVERAGCRSPMERESEEYLQRLAQDLCRNDGAWVLQLLESKVLQCSDDFENAFTSKEAKECLQGFGEYRLTGVTVTVGGYRQLEWTPEFCNFTGKAGHCLLESVITACKRNPKPGEILRNTFSDSNAFWSAKCASGGDGIFHLLNTWWPLLLLVLFLSVCFCLWRTTVPGGGTLEPTDRLAPAPYQPCRNCCSVIR